MNNLKHITLAILFSSLIIATPGCGDKDEPDPGDQIAEMTFSSDNFKSGEPIPKLHSCEGFNANPQLTWSGAPSSTLSYALVIDDPDAIPVAGFIWDHWLMCNIPATTTSLQSGMSPFQINELNALVLKNSSGKNSYEGPCPPPGQNHTYEFEIYALDVAALPQVTATTTKAAYESVIAQHTVGKGTFTGTYSR